MRYPTTILQRILGVKGSKNRWTVDVLLIRFTWLELQVVFVVTRSGERDRFHSEEGSVVGCRYLRCLLWKDERGIAKETLFELPIKEALSGWVEGGTQLSDGLRSRKCWRWVSLK